MKYVIYLPAINGFVATVEHGRFMVTRHPIDFAQKFESEEATLEYMNKHNKSGYMFYILCLTNNPTSYNQSYIKS